MHHVGKLATMLSVALLFTFTALRSSSAADTPSGIADSRNQILGVTNQNQKNNSDDPPANNGNPGPLPCNSKNNPKCNPASKSRPEDGRNNGDDHGQNH